jgi:integrase
MPNASTCRIPAYCRHKGTDQAVVYLNGKAVYLGKHGTSASRQEYERVIGEWLAHGRQLPQSGDLTVNELILAYWEQHCRHHYRKADGTPTTRQQLVRMALRPLKELYGTTAAGAFGPLALKAVRQKMVGLNWSRGVINEFVGIVKRMFRWATENELVPPSVYHGLQAVAGLQKGRCDARETEPVRPVPEAFINAVLPHLAPAPRAMVQLQLLTAMRPGEACIMRGCDLDMTGRVWVYRPASHKTKHTGRDREIYLGPQAQEAIKPFLKTDLTAYLFSPWEAREWRFEQMRQRRRNKVQPSQACRRKKNARRLPRDHYDTSSYRRAISYACLVADRQAHRSRPEAPKDETIIPAWNPHRLRHNAATNLRKQFGVELARIILGHATAFTTEIYAEADRLQAMEVIGRVG